ncbi:MAG TPA: hypothetical protein VK627_07720 [Edaphobacter sp.]|nr:hypothetical protein [Edaphobacter sp.]
MELPLSAEQTAEATGLLPLFERMKALTAEPNTANQWELMFLQQQVMLQVTSASLQVDAAAGQIDAEIAETRELENYLSGRRDSRVDLLNLVSLGIGGTMGTASSALGLTVHDHAAAVTGIVAGAATAALSLAGLRVRRGEAHELLVPSNMLSKVFAHPSDANNVYPPVVVAFMNSIAPNDEAGLSRQDRLIRSWVEVGRIPEPDSAKGREKIDHLTSLPGEKVKQSIADLEDRQAMLYDLRVRLNYMKQDLAILLASVPPVTMPATNAGLVAR